MSEQHEIALSGGGDSETAVITEYEADDVCKLT